MIADAKKKKKHTDDVKKELYNPETMVNVSSKERRKRKRDSMQEEQRQKQFYYEFNNVKNKNRDKAAQIDEKLSTRGHTKKKPRTAKK